MITRKNNFKCHVNPETFNWILLNTLYPSLSTPVHLGEKQLYMFSGINDTYI